MFEKLLPPGALEFCCYIHCTYYC